jgi:hypothetical protein
MYVHCTPAPQQFCVRFLEVKVHSFHLECAFRIQDKNPALHKPLPWGNILRQNPLGLDGAYALS